MKEKNNIRYLLSVFMFLSSFYPWAVFLLKAVNSKPMPLSLISFLFFIVSVFFIFFQKRKYIVPASAAGFIISVIICCSIYYAGDGFSPFPLKTSESIISCLLIIIFVFSIWTASFRIISRSPGNDVLRIRFDLGLTAFFLLLLIKLIIKTKGGDIFVYESSADCFVSFLLSGFLALVIRSGSVTSHIIKSSAVVFVFFIFIITVSSGIFYFLSPELKELAFSGSDVLGKAGSVFEQELALFIRFFLDFRYRSKVLDGVLNRSFSTGAASSSGNVPDEVFYVFLGFIVLMILSAAAVLLYLFAKAIFRSLNKNRDEKNIDKIDLRQLLIFFGKIIRIIMMKNISPPELRFFRYLKIFGHIKGVKCFNYETPREYAARLSSRFNSYKDEVFLITEVHDDFLYGGIKADKGRIKTASACLKKMINPLLCSKRKD